MRQRKAAKTEPRSERCECFCMGAGPAFTELLEKLRPPEPARKHFEEARLEFLRGMRALLDARIHDYAKPPRPGAKVTVE